MNSFAFPLGALPKVYAACSVPSPLVPYYSSHAARLLHAQPQLEAALTQRALLQRAGIEQLLQELLQAEVSAHGAEISEATLSKVLRQLKQKVLLAAMHADLSGEAELSEITGAMSYLAEVALQHAAQFLFDELAQRHGSPSQPFMIIGMGKLGGRELNVSSDIDLIFAYPADGDTTKGMPYQEFFTQLARRLIRLISEVTAHGYVFRVDMRLRPNGEAGPLVSSFTALERYFYEQGRAWERYAWIKARVVACIGSSSADSSVTKATKLSSANTASNSETNPCLQYENELEALRRPFVFRKYLDYNAISAVRELHRQIRAERSRRDQMHPARSNDVKLGRGGIREIEFVAQLFQLIRGGRIPALQTRPTQVTLNAALNLGLLDTDVVEDLQQAYVFLRMLEHRLQYIEDAQTHAVPPEAEKREHIAAMMGLPSADALIQTLEQVRRRVAEIFDSLFEADKNSHSETPNDALPWLNALDSEEGINDASRDLQARGFRNAAALAQAFASFTRGSRFRSLPAQSRSRLETLMPALLNAALSTAQPDDSLKRGLDLLESISQRSAYLALLTEYPHVLKRIATLLAASPWAAQFLNQHPLLLDELIDTRESLAAPNWKTERQQLTHTLNTTLLPNGQPDVERRLDLLREFHHLWTFRLLAEDLAGRLSVETLADHLSALADTLISIVIEQCWAQLLTRHRDTPQFAVIAYGKLGGKELGYASDLDIIFVYDDDDERAPEIYARLAQRIMSWLTSHTSAGRLYNADLRLRPNGNAGLLVSSLTAFADYQLGRGSNAAWLWEHQALTRARFCAGHTSTGEQFEAIRKTVLMTPRDRATVLREIAAMRQKIHDGHPNPTELFDLKHDAGGMIDIEFIVQALVLLHSPQWPAFTANSGNIALLHLAGQQGLLPAALVETCAQAYRAYRAHQHVLRLQAQTDEPPPARVSAEEFSTFIQAVKQTWQQFFEAEK